MTLNNKDMKILVVDDFLTMRRIVKTLLRQLGFSQFVEAEDSQAAIDILSQTEDIELIIFDYKTIEARGLDFLKSVRSNAKYKDIPFIIVAAESEQEQVKEVVDAGADNYIVKPFSTTILKEKIESALDKTDTPEGE